MLSSMFPVATHVHVIRGRVAMCVDVPGVDPLAAIDAYLAWQVHGRRPVDLLDAVDAAMRSGGTGRLLPGDEVIPVPVEISVDPGRWPDAMPPGPAW